MQKLYTFGEKRYLNIQISAGVVPAVFKSAGVLALAPRRQRPCLQQLRHHIHPPPKDSPAVFPFGSNAACIKHPLLNLTIRDTGTHTLWTKITEIGGARGVTCGFVYQLCRLHVPRIRHRRTLADS